MTKHIPLDKIVLGRNLRLETDRDLGGLIESIEKSDQVVPITVRKIGDGKYELIAGFRRYEALRALNLPTIECSIREDITSEKDVIAFQLIENAQRRQLTPREYGHAFRRLKQLDRSLSYEAIGRLFGKSGPWVSAKIRSEETYDQLLAHGFDEDMIDNVGEKLAKDLSRVKAPEEKVEVAKQILAGASEKIIPRAASYIPPAKQTHHSYTRGGVDILYGKKGMGLEIRCSTKAVQSEVEELICQVRELRLQKRRRGERDGNDREILKRPRFLVEAPVAAIPRDAKALFAYEDHGHIVVYSDVAPEGHDCRLMDCPRGVPDVHVVLMGQAH